ncbi:hypothetical protein P879_11064 [Paragonimus westermani]|uniref:Uncharacterized protein n=1 Tax=Paragonimus westermani TaxID=34504 RepID=A0A8T0D2H4_9TREM|nr:hypothetical protein P879_11064 [Paragonimus westermani]
MIFSLRRLKNSGRCLLDSSYNFNLNHFLLPNNPTRSSRQTTSFHSSYLVLSIRGSTSLCICCILWEVFSTFASSVLVP